MQVLRQLLREFLLPLIVAVGWSLYNFKDTPLVGWSIRDFVNVFGPTFFFANWLGAQWFRVRKQQKVESGLSSIDAAVRTNIEKLQQTSDHLVGYITGGSSFCYLAPPPSNPDHWVAIMVVHCGPFPLYDVRARLSDLDQVSPDPVTVEHLFASEERMEIGDLVPGLAKAVRLPPGLVGRSRIQLNIFFAARNGSFVQQFCAEKIADKWESAIRVLKDESILLEKVTPGFPKNSGGTVEWDA